MRSCCCHRSWWEELAEDVGNTALDDSRSGIEGEKADLRSSEEIATLGEAVSSECRPICTWLNLHQLNMNQLLRPFQLAAHLDISSLV